MEETNKRVSDKGGRIAKNNAEYFTMSGVRSVHLKYLKMKYESDGIDFYISVFETLCTSPYFLWQFSTRFQLEVFLTEKSFKEERFNEILKFAVEELSLFDKVLYDYGFLFSIEFVKTFDLAGLFRQRSIKALDILRYANSKRGDATPLTLTNSAELHDEVLPF